MNRRHFLQFTIATGLPPLVGVGELAAFQTTPPPIVPGVPDWVVSARADIPATGGRYFQTAGIAPSPRSVMEAVREALEFQNEGPASPEVGLRMDRVEPDVRARISSLCGVAEDEVALTHSTSEGISIAAWSVDWQPGDEVIISDQEHPANTIPWYILHDRLGVVVRRVGMGTGVDLLAGVRAALTSRTRMVSISHVSRNNGRRLTDNESAELALLLRARDVRYHLDGAQGPGCVRVNVDALGCDYYSLCGHKWLLSPKGVGAFLVRRDILDRTLISWAGSHSHVTMDALGGYTLIPAARRFEFGTRALADFAGFDAAIAWQQRIGLQRIHQRIEDLVAYAIRRAGALGFVVVSPIEPAQYSGIFVIRLPQGCMGLAIYEALRTRAATYTSPVDHERDLRISIHFFNTTEEIDAALDTIWSYCAKP
jgi:cysteine desulfurase / selenocysteine lyase